MHPRSIDAVDAFLNFKKERVTMKRKNQVLAAMLSLTLAFGMTGCGDGKSAASDNESQTSAVPGSSTDNSNVDFGLAKDMKGGSILHCFAWSFNTITESMADIAAAGYSTIQTSPINACYDGGNGGMELFGEGKWSYHYQPTDWTIGNYQLGSRDEFKNMCEVAEKYGIKVIVDVVPNHTTKETSAVSQNLIQAAGGSDRLYHSNGLESITAYTDRSQCTLMAVGGLPDVDTENKGFQDYFIAFLNDCIDCGADGFRYDTAKHIGLSDDPKDTDGEENNFWERAIKEIHNASEIFNYGEVLQDGGERIGDYINAIGATTASSYGAVVRDAAMSRTFDAQKLTDFRVGGSSNVVTWVESHDNYTGDEKTYFLLEEPDIILGWAIIAARGEGTPLFFSRPYNSTADNMWGSMNRIGMAGDTLYKDATVVAVNRFRNAMEGESETLSNMGENKNVLLISRGNKGLVIVNGKGDNAIDAQTSLPDGTYTNRVDNTTTFTVSGGKITGSMKDSSVAVLYEDGYKEIGEVPFVGVSDEDSEVFYTDTHTVRLVSRNCKNASYSIDGGEPVSFMDGDTLTVGSGVMAGNIIAVRLTAESESGLTTTVTYEFSKKQGTAAGTVIYFKKPSDWNADVCAYVYDETSGSEVRMNASWPGVAMKSEGGDLYSYTFEEDWIAPLVIFTDGKNQSNGEMEPGAKVENGKTYELQ